MRLLTPQEKLSLLNRVDTQPLSDTERNEITQKFMDDKAERRRQRKRLRQHGKEVWDPKKCKKLNERFQNLNDIFNKTNVRESERSL